MQDAHRAQRVHIGKKYISKFSMIGGKYKSCWPKQEKCGRRRRLMIIWNEKVKDFPTMMFLLIFDIWAGTVWMQDVDVSLVTYCPRQSSWHPTSLRRPFAPGSRKRHIIKPWDQFQRFTHWWFGVAHVQGWLEGESFSIQLSFGTIEENLADIIIQHALLCSWW